MADISNFERSKGDCYFKKIELTLDYLENDQVNYADYECLHIYNAILHCIQSKPGLTVFMAIRELYVESGKTDLLKLIKAEAVH